MMRNIVLIGFMGCGKTVIGRCVSSYLKYKHIDTDDYIVKNAGMSITEIFGKFGEAHFRELESQAAMQISEYEHYVISTGGGIVKSEENMRLLKKNGTVVYLKCSPDKIYRNTKNSTHRPLLNTGNRLEKIELLLEEREPLYVKYADFVLDTTNLSVEEAAKAICQYNSGGQKTGASTRL